MEALVASAVGVLTAAGIYIIAWSHLSGGVGVGPVIVCHQYLSVCHRTVKNQSGTDFK